MPYQYLSIPTQFQNPQDVQIKISVPSDTHDNKIANPQAIQDQIYNQSW